MADPPKELSHPTPRALRDLRGIRRQLVTIYREAKAGLVEPQLFGRLVNCLNTLQAIDNNKLVEERMSEIEAKLAITKPNGHDRTELRQ
jgi:hypothetical protein